MAHETGPLVLRAATAADQAAIKALVRRAGINPLAIHWPNFLVIKEINSPAGHGRLVAIGQVKPHRDGSRELASIAVEPDWQRAGLAALLIGELLRREPGTLYLYCAGTMPVYYRRFGFTEVPVRELPRSMRPPLYVGQALVALINLFGGHERLTAMRRLHPGQ